MTRILHLIVFTTILEREGHLLLDDAAKELLAEYFDDPMPIGGLNFERPAEMATFRKVCNPVMLLLRNSFATGHVQTGGNPLPPCLAYV